MLPPKQEKPNPCSNKKKKSKKGKIHHANINQKNAGVTILTSDKVNFRAKNITKNKE